MTQGAKVLVVGSGGREHALALKLLSSPSVAEVLVLPGNAGTERASGEAVSKTLRNVTGDPVEIAGSEKISLCVIGPEAPLCEGLSDRLADAGVLAFGPSQGAARLEGSKAYMKSFAARFGLKTARHETVTSIRDAERVIRSFARPPVVKADGLCGGKGVVVASTADEALDAARAMLTKDRFGDAGKRVVIEEQLEGSEASVHAICDGTRALLLPSAQDHKRIGDGDTGQNTGGMGTYGPAPLVTASLIERVREEIVERTLYGMAKDGVPYRGALFAGLMITPDGEPYLLEFNVRFGDPETQVLMNLFDGDLAELLGSAARGRLAPDAIRVSSDHALCVVLAAGGYPGTPRTGDEISGIEAAAARDGVTLYHAGTRRGEGGLVTAGGRVLGVTARGRTLLEAHDRAYGAAELIHFEGKQMRRDIGRRALPSAS